MRLLFCLLYFLHLFVVYWLQRFSFFFSGKIAKQEKKKKLKNANDWKSSISFEEKFINVWIVLLWRVIYYWNLWNERKNIINELKKKQKQQTHKGKKVLTTPTAFRGARNHLNNRFVVFRVNHTQASFILLCICL